MAERSIPSAMRAVVIRESVGPEALELESRPVPSLREG